MPRSGCSSAHFTPRLISLLTHQGGKQCHPFPGDIKHRPLSRRKMGHTEPGWRWFHDGCTALESWLFLLSLWISYTSHCPKPQPPNPIQPGTSRGSHSFSPPSQKPSFHIPGLAKGWKTTSEKKNPGGKTGQKAANFCSGFFPFWWFGKFLRIHGINGNYAE